MTKSVEYVTIWKERMGDLKAVEIYNTDKKVSEPLPSALHHSEEIHRPDN
jgi:hypothetical protein